MKCMVGIQGGHYFNQSLCLSMPHPQKHKNIDYEDNNIII